MIEITVKPTGVTIKGHADKTKADHALVCCAVSTVIQSFALVFGNLSDKPLAYRIAEGDSFLDWGNAADSVGYMLVEGLYIVLAKLAADNPDHIIFKD